MSKETGLGWTTFTVDTSGGVANDLRNDTTDLSWKMPRAIQECTGLDKSGVERLLLLADYSGDCSGVFNDAAGCSHVTFKDIPTTSVQRTVAIGVSGQTLSAECVLPDYSMSRNDKGEFTWKVSWLLANGTPPAWS
jgi:hypothetical protein